MYSMCFIIWRKLQTPSDKKSGPCPMASLENLGLVRASEFSRRGF